jgi:hypothetical protein
MDKCTSSWWGKPRRRRSLGRPRSRWEMGLQLILGRLAGVCGVDYIGSGI